MPSRHAAIVIGSGPNGLVAACRLARAGLPALVLEQHATRLGGACATVESTLPGFRHDVGASFFPFAEVSPAFRALDLARHGLRFAHAPIDSAHPAPDGSCAVLSRDLDAMARDFGDPKDAARWDTIARWHRRIEARLLEAAFHPLLPILPSLRLLPGPALHLGRMFIRSAAGLSRRLFGSAAAQRVIPSLALHADIGPDDAFGAAVGYMLAVMATTGGFGVPIGGAGAITQALAHALIASGGEVRLGAKVERIIVRSGRAVAVRLSDGEEIETNGPIIADTGAAALLLDLLDGAAVPRRVQARMRRFPQGWGTFKLDWALSGPVPWSDARCRDAAVVHLGDDLDDLRRFTAEVRAGRLPSRPYLVIGQQSRCDPSRAPAGNATLWAYTHTPASPPDGTWHDHAERLADLIEARIEAQAPGFRATVRARAVVTPKDLERDNPNLVGGDLGGGSNGWRNQAVFRPVLPWYRHRMPIAGVYLGSSYTHPGPGVHGVCGWNAAGIALRDQGISGDAKAR